MSQTIGQGKQQIEKTEWVDCDGLRDMFGIKRSLAYALMGEGVIKAVSLRSPRHPKATRGKRLFEVSSVRAYLDSLK